MKRVALLAALVACSSAAPPPPVPPKVADITGPRIEDSTVEGYVTLVDFWSESCAACFVVADKIAPQIAGNDRVIVRKVDVGDGFTPIAQAYKISALPHWKVYDTKRRLRFILVGPDCLRAPDLANQLLSER
ncbi:MAG TPA: thioredoxin family protein [Kofleriaceae bacterium]|nr:thioredoxin family protein [Kofleriaceae bacterium]